MAKKERQKEVKEKKPKKGASDKASAPKDEAAEKAVNVNETKLDRGKVTAEQLTQAQIEEAIKESQDPSSKLRKVRSPISVGSCLLNILVLVVLTVGIVLLCCYFMLDKETFSLKVVVKDIFDQYGITRFFRSIGNWFKRLFS